MVGGSFEIERTGVRIPTPRPKALPVSVEAGFPETEEEEAPETDVTIVEAPSEAPVASAVAAPERSDQPNGNGDGRGRKRRRRRRGGRGRNGPQQQQGPEAEMEAGPNGAEPVAHFGHAAGDAIAGEAEDDDEEAGPEQAGEAQQADGRPATTPMGEGSEKRRRRRRRGRRGRRRDGELGHAPNDTVARLPETDISAAPAYSGERREEQHPVVMPNAESSPLWSLNDRSPEAPAPYIRATEPVAEAEAPQFEAINPIAESAPVPLRIENEPVAAPDDAAASNESPREARKGWWQRRFKG